MESYKNSPNENVIIISRDAVFARMLELELKKESINAKTVSDVTGAPALIYLTSSYPLSVFDADLITDEKPNESPIFNKSASCFIVFSRKTYDFPQKNVTVFFTRPFDIRSFIDAVKSQLSVNNEAQTEINIKRKIPLNFDYKTKNVIYGSHTVRLSNKEFELLALLYSKKGETVTKDEIKKEIWSDISDDQSNIDNVYIRYLREKLDDALGIKLIYTVRNKGYILKLPE